MVVSTSPQAAPRNRASKMPNLQTFRPLDPNWHQVAYDASSVLFQDQMNTVVEMKQALRATPPDMDLSRPRLWELERSFAGNILKSLALLDSDMTTKHLRVAELTEYAEGAVSTCIALLIFAVGAIAMDPTVYVESSQHLPGFAYYSRAVAILNEFPSPGSGLDTLVGRILSGTYPLSALRPLLAWREISQASQECIILLKSTQLSKETAQFRDAFSRIYWVCYALGQYVSHQHLESDVDLFLSELEVCLELPPTGLRQYDSVVPFPVSDFEEEGLYYILAKASLRKLMMEVADTVGLTSTSDAPYAPIVMIELPKQIDDWYQHLPSSLRFPINHNRLFDSRRSHLRCQYYSLIAVVTWRFVFHGENPYGERPEDAESARQGAQECLRACLNYIQSAEEILTQRSLESHLVMRGFFAMTMILIIAPPAMPDETEEYTYRSLLAEAIQNLSYWKAVPFMRRPLDEMERIARLKGVRVER